MADVAALTDDKNFLKAIDTIWENVVRKKIYVQGGIGAIGDGERFGENYQLPNATAYNETCAAIANVYWNHRMFLLHGDAKYIDILEKSLYNGLISGVGMDGKSFFYTNAMEIKNIFLHKDMEASRSGWFPCSCCPTNITRLIPSVPGYLYAQQDNHLYVNLFAASNTNLQVSTKNVQIVQENNYPWEGKLRFKISPASPLDFNLMIRIPGWAQQEAMPSDLYRFSNSTKSPIPITINGKPVAYTIERGFAKLHKVWRKNDVVEVILPMNINVVHAHEKVSDDRGKISLQRGPLTYCAEWADNFGSTSNLILSGEQQKKLSESARPDLLNGVMVITGEVTAIKVDPAVNQISSVKQNFTAIPYYAWAHRGKGEMTVWFPEKITGIDIISK
jgi:DUF1680 family protein